VPELPEVEALTRFLDDRTRGTTIVRIELATFSALKTFDPPLDSLKGRVFDGWQRRGKYLAGDLGGLWLTFHLARGGWVQWREQLAPGRPKLGRGPLALRVGLDTGPAST
jgi:formamidopyrimidine-DNA glycosylase